MIEQQRQQQDNLVKRINIEHNFDKNIESICKKYKESINLPSISDKELLYQLKEKKKDKMFDFLNNLLEFRELYKDARQFNKNKSK